MLRAAIWRTGLLAALLLAASQVFGAVKGTEVLLGSAQVDITPPVGHRMAGYFEERFSTGVHDPLYAKALVLKQGSESIGLVFCDLLGVSLGVSSRARLQASTRTGIPTRNIMICASHSHTGPLFDDVMREYYHERAFSEFGQDRHEEVYYPDVLVEAIVQALTQAAKEPVPVDLVAGLGKLEGLSFNRRFHMTDGSVQFNPGVKNPEIIREAGPVDHTVGILLARNKSAETIAGITVFACHCDTTGGTQFSADYPHYLSQRLQEAFGKSYVSAFGAGTCGDINHINVRAIETIARAGIPERLGTNLAITIIDAQPKLRKIERPRLRSLSRVLRIPLQEATHEEANAARQKLAFIEKNPGAFFDKVNIAKRLDLARMGSTWPMEVQVFGFDDQTAIVCLPGEVFVDLGLEIKRKSPFVTTMVVSICNDRPGYIPTLKAFAEGSYEVTNSRIKPEGGEQLVAAAVEMLNELKRDLR